MKDERTVRIEFGFGLSKTVVVKKVCVKGLSDAATDQKIYDAIESERAKRKHEYPTNWWLVN